MSVTHLYLKTSGRRKDAQQHNTRRAAIAAAALRRREAANDKPADAPVRRRKAVTNGR